MYPSQAEDLSYQRKQLKWCSVSIDPSIQTHLTRKTKQQRCDTKNLQPWLINFVRQWSAWRNRCRTLEGAAGAVVEAAQDEQQPPWPVPWLLWLLLESSDTELTILFTLFKEVIERLSSIVLLVWKIRCMVKVWISIFHGLNVLWFMTFVPDLSICKPWREVRIFRWWLLLFVCCTSPIPINWCGSTDTLAKITTNECCHPSWMSVPRLS